MKQDTQNPSRTDTANEADGWLSIANEYERATRKRILKNFIRADNPAAYKKRTELCIPDGNFLSISTMEYRVASYLLRLPEFELIAIERTAPHNTNWTEPDYYVNEPVHSIQGFAGETSTAMRDLFIDVVKHVSNGSTHSVIVDTERLDGDD